MTARPVASRAEKLTIYAAGRHREPAATTRR